MAVLGVIEAWEMGGESSETGGSTTRVFQVLCNDPTLDTPWRILNYVHPNLPIIGEIYPPLGATPTDKELMMRARARRMRGGSRYPLYVIEVPYRTDMGYHEISPLGEYPDTSYDTEVVREPIDTDADGNPIQMSNLEGLDPKLEMRVSDLVQRISTNVAYFDQPTWVQPYINTTNAAELTIDWVEDAGSMQRVPMLVDPGMLLIEKISGQRVYFGNKTSPDYVYYNVQVQSRIRTTDDPITGQNVFHKIRVRDEGYRELTGYDANSNPIYKDILQGTRTVRKPVPLDGAGLRLTQGAQPFWHLWKVYDEANHDVFFEYLGIPQST